MSSSRDLEVKAGALPTAISSRAEIFGFITETAKQSEATRHIPTIPPETAAIFQLLWRDEKENKKEQRLQNIRVCRDWD